MKLFETIKIKQEHLEAVKAITEMIDEDRALLDDVGGRLNKHRHLLFASIGKLYPELANYDYSFNHEECTIKILGFKKVKYE